MSRRKPSLAKKPWYTMTPMTSKERKLYPVKCFLDPDNRKYPICYKHTHEPSCVGIKAAERRASLQRNHKIQARAQSLIKKHNCNSQSKKSLEHERVLRKRSLSRSKKE